MNHGQNFPMFRLILSFALLSVVMPVMAQTRHQDSWLDRPLINWNRVSRRLAQPPRPPAPDDSDNANRCRRQVRRPTNAAERVLVQRGWMMYGPAYSYGGTGIVTGLSSFDGMCRPIGFQAFVYTAGRYAGTLSPTLMNSRSDGSLTDVHVSSATSISADFARYRDSDPLCCPSRISSVAYSLRRDGTLIPRRVRHRPVSETSEQNPKPEAQTSALLGKRWTLTQLEERRLSPGRAYIQFVGDQNRASGSGGCNSFAGTFEIDGSALSLSRIASTKRACLDAELQRLETEFLRVLETTTRFEVQDNRLRLYAGDRLILAFIGN
jgi:heat shock protein HslJ